MTVRYSLAPDMEHHFRIIVGASGGGPLWHGDSSAPRASFYVWKSPAGVWRAYAGGGHALSPMRFVAEGPTRSSAFANALRVEQKIAPQPLF